MISDLIYVSYVVHQQLISHIITHFL